MRRGRIFIYLGLLLIVGLVAVFFLISRQAAPPPSSPGPDGAAPPKLLPVFRWLLPPSELHGERKLQRT